MGYTGLQQLFTQRLVDRFDIDVNTAKPDCIECTESKQSTEPFPTHTDHVLYPGELTHMDIWGKYPKQSINGNQYYIVFVDDAMRFTTMSFLKAKDETSQRVINYMTHLQTNNKMARAIRTDSGKEFINDRLQTWYTEHGITVQTTAPYSPSQNGIAERMNRTLVELARTMLRGQNVPEFLWEYAVAHAAYIHNHSYTKHLPEKTPYEAWYGKHPSIAHLREFGTPVWILLQGPSERPKMQPKSQRRIYVGYQDGSRSVTADNY